MKVELIALNLAEPRRRDTHATPDAPDRCGTGGRFEGTISGVDDGKVPARITNGEEE